MNILGIDPGYAIIGWGVLEYKNNHFKVIDFGAITTNAGEYFPQRLSVIDKDLKKIIDTYHPQVMSMEITL